MKLQYFENYKQLSVSELKQRYRELSKRYHPDTANGNDLEMAIINKEYSIALKWHEKRQKQKQLRIEMINKVSDKTLKGIEALQPVYEPELKELAIKKGKILINKKVPKQYREIAGLLLEKVVSGTNVLKLAQSGISQIKQRIKM